MNIIHASPAEIWYIVGVVGIAIGGKLMLSGKRLLSWIGVLLIIVSLGVCVEGFRYSHNVLGHIEAEGG